MLSVERAVLIINSVKLCLMLGKDATRHAIAKNIKSVSRSTIYRVTHKAYLLGFVNFVLNNAGDKVFYVTSKGYELLDAQKELM